MEGHDALLQALGGMYRGLLLGQKNRPKAADYFDLMPEVPIPAGTARRVSPRGIGAAGTGSRRASCPGRA